MEHQPSFVRTLRLGKTMSFFIENTTYKIDITDPDGETSWVELKRLNSGDIAHLHDTLGMKEGAEGEAATPDVKLGAWRMMTVELAIVNWGLPLSPTPSTIQALHPKVFQQIYDAVDIGDGKTNPLEKTDLPTK